MKVNKIKSFLEQAELDIEKYRALIISTEHGDKGKTAERLEQEAKPLGIETYIVPLQGTYLTVEDGETTVYNLEKDEKGFKIDPDNTVVFFRGSPERLSYLDLITQLERLGFPVINSRSCLERANDKYRTYLRLKEFGLEQPKTVLVTTHSGVDDIDVSVEKLNSKFPMIMKTLTGSKGVGVLFVESERSLKALVQTLYKTNPETDLLLQEYVKTEFDVRVLVLNNTVIASMRRDVVEGDFRSNATQGAKVKPFKLTKLEEDQCIHAAKSIGGIFSGVDFIPSKDRENQKPFFLEVNHSPGTEGIEEATGKNISKIILQHFLDKNKRHTVPRDCGFLETVYIKPWGPIIAKFDTGNSSLPVIHGDDIELKGRTVSFTLFDKRVSLPHVKTMKVNLGGLRDYSEERHTVKLDMDFAGKIYKDVEFTVDDRRNRTRILLNRNIMRRLNVIVDPQRKYMITTKLEVKENE